MLNITVNASRKYDVVIGEGLMESAGRMVRGVSSARKVCVICDTTTRDLFSETVIGSLAGAGFDTHLLIFAPGEQTKSMSNLSRILEYLADRHFTRTDLLVALGGGVIGDLTGFAAACYLRGINFVQMPTTLLSAVDASVGGKTAVNLKAGKNLAGAFHQPAIVLFDTNAMESLPEEQFKEGLSEIIKCGVIGDKDLFEYVAYKEAPRINDFVEMTAERAIIVKRDLVEQDEYDVGPRKLLNFGHTMGHAVELCSGYEISHGHAVAMGMLAACKASYRKGWSNEDCAIPVWQTLERYGIDPKCPFDADELASAALKDKKRSGTKISLVVPLQIGEGALMDIDVEELPEFFRLGLEG